VTAERKLVVKHATALTTALSGEGQTSPSVAVKQGAAVSDKATLAGAGVAGAAGTVTYKVYADPSCKSEVANAGTVPVSGGLVPASQPETLEQGVYYWQASYSGDAANLPAAGACGSEVEHVEAAAPQGQGPGQSPLPPATNTGTGSGSSGVAGSTTSYKAGLAATSLSVSASGSVIVKVACLGTSSCAGALTLRTLGALSAGKHKSILTLASARFSLLGGHIKALTLHLSHQARKLLAHGHVLKARATIVARDSSGASHTTAVIVTLREKRHH
jgi:hypothetical protein